MVVCSWWCCGVQQQPPGRSQTQADPHHPTGQAPVSTEPDTEFADI